MVRPNARERREMAIDKLLTQQPRYVEGHGMLDGRTVVVTAGAGGGIGRWAALRCLEEGARAVIVGDVHARRLDAVRDEFAETVGEDRVATAVCDASDEAQVQGLFDLAD